MSLEVWLLPPSSATIMAALQQRRLLIDSPSVDVREPQPRRLRVTGGGIATDRHLWEMTDSKYLNLCKDTRGDNEDCHEIGGVSSQHLFHQAFPPPVRCNRLTARGYRMCQNTHQNPFCLIRDSNGKVFSKRQKISFSKIRSKHARHHSREEITHICTGQRCAVYLRRSC